ncbi:MFS transporter [Thalassobaculum sp.]|uniref:MFS transporter n=1 Tax=Thalassobaculum sp. TaxID=2022740 RepID=UPI0032EF12CF
MSPAETLAMPNRSHAAAATLRHGVIAVISFLTLVDLFATQAILPTLTAHYAVTPAAMGFAVNASTIGMAAAGLAVALVGGRIDRRIGVSASLAALAIPTLLLAGAPDLTTFTVLRIAQGVCMSAAFTLTMAYLAESSTAEETAGMLAAYITGNVASNFVGRLASALLADQLGLVPNFLFLAALNLIGAAIAYAGLRRCTRMGMGSASADPVGLAAWVDHFRHPPLAAGFAVGFLILFAFIGTFTYVNFVLVAAPIAISPMTLGVVYFVFMPSMLTTPLAGRAVSAFGTRRTFRSALALALAGLPLLILPSLTAVLVGLALVAVGTFFAQAAATGFIGRAATRNRGSASGLYLASYYTGGLAGAALLGPVFDTYGWPAAVAGVGAALALATVLAGQLTLPPQDPR